MCSLGEMQPTKSHHHHHHHLVTSCEAWLITSHSATSTSVARESTNFSCSRRARVNAVDGGYAWAVAFVRRPVYSQTSISDHFQDGSPIHRLVADLKSGTVHPLQLRPLRVIDRPGRGLVTLDHRLRTPDRLTGTGPQLCSRGLEPQ